MEKCGKEGTYVVYKICKTAQSAQRQRELEHGLMEAMKTERYEDISISELCSCLGIPRKTFYRYFDSKDGALYGLIDHTLLEYESFSSGYLSSGKRTLQRELEQFFLFWLEKRTLLDVLHSSGLSGILIERAINFALTDTVMPRRFLPEDTEEMQKHITMFGVCGLLSMVLSWHEGGFSESVSQMAKVSVRLLGAPLFPDAQRFLG